jgi:hypothetical protein
VFFANVRVVGWITALDIAQENVAVIVRIGRSGWQIENEV